MISKNESPKSTNKKMPIFNCSCGAKILVIPDLQEMEKAIKNHLIEHKKATGQLLTEDMVAEGIINALSEYFLNSSI
jgi:hypothetical protein